VNPPSQLLVLARKAASVHSLDPSLVCAVVEQESGWNPWAMRYEPAFFSKYVAPLYTNNKIAATEAYSRGFSWGLMQVPLIDTVFTISAQFLRYNPRTESL